MHYFVTTDKTKIFYTLNRYENTNYTLVFLHGLGGDMTAWSPIIKDLNKRKISNLYLDLRGHGFSSRPLLVSSYNLNRMSEDITEILFKLKLENYILIGHCFGGIVSTHVVSSSPNICNKLILVNTPIKAPVLGGFTKKEILSGLLQKIASILPRSKRSVHRDFTKFIGTADYSIKRLLSDILATSLRSYISILSITLKLDIIPILKQIKIPTLVISGTNDSIAGPKTAKVIASNISRSRLVLIKGENHILPINNPAVLKKEILKFINLK